MKGKKHNGMLTIQTKKGFKGRKIRIVKPDADKLWEYLDLPIAG